MQVTQHPHGTFSYVDLNSTDADSAKKYYTNLFGWASEDEPLPMGGVYTTFLQDGKTVAAVSQMSPEMEAGGMPSVWNSYVTVDDVDGIAEKATELGGTVIAPPFDVMEYGRMAVIQDPTGAVFSVWQAGKSIGAQLVNVPNSLCWNELLTRDTEVATAFYTALFGWTTQVNDVPMPYTTWMNGERMNGGMMGITDEMPADMPAHWMAYFAVEDVDAIVAKSNELGGHTTVEPFDAGDVGRIAILQDPAGGTFSIIKFAVPTD